MKKISLTVLFSATIATLAVCGQASTALADTTPSVVPVRDVQPEYPASALRRDASGYVTVRFDVDADGRAQNVDIVASQPENTFDAAVLTAVRRSTFEVQGAESSSLENVERTYRFGYEDSENISMNDARHSNW